MAYCVRRNCSKISRTVAVLCILCGMEREETVDVSVFRKLIAIPVSRRFFLTQLEFLVTVVYLQDCFLVVCKFELCNRMFSLENTNRANKSYCEISCFRGGYHEDGSLLGSCAV